MRESSRVIPAGEYRNEPWRNGLGSTREIACGQVDSLSGSAGTDRDVLAGCLWPWRLSIADIDQDSVYSSFRGVQREQVLLSGNGLRLMFDDGGMRELAPPHGGARFDGRQGVHAELLDGPVHVFNLMWRSENVSARLLHRPLAGSMVFFVEPGVLWAIHMLAGQADFDLQCGLPALRQGDTALLAGGAAGKRCMLEGGGEILAIRIAANDGETVGVDPAFQ